MKCLLTRGPLARKLLENEFHDRVGIPIQVFPRDPLPVRALHKLVLNILDIPRIPHLVMSEIEPFPLVDGFA